MIRALWVMVVGIVASAVCATTVIVAGFFKMKNREGGIYDRVQNAWARAIVWAAGVKVVVHGAEHVRGEQRIIVGNHVSWFDVFALASVMPRCRFVAKREVRSIPLVGPAAGIAGHVYIARENRKAAFEQYTQAAAGIHAGVRVVVFAEGTRGRDYALRPFKKGPFVLAVSAGAPIVPMLIHGTIPVMAKGSFRVRPGTVDIHFLPPIETEGLTYEDRDRLAVATRTAIGGVLQREYGVQSPPWSPRGAAAAQADAALD